MPGWSRGNSGSREIGPETRCLDRVDSAVGLRWDRRLRRGTHMSRRYRERVRIDDGRALPNFIAMSELPQVLDSTDPVPLKA
jgi:hypothetical protein